MRKLIFALAVLVTVGLFAATNQAVAGVERINELNEPGAILVYPLIDNINGVTIVNIANTSPMGQILECYMVTHGPDNGIDEKKDFLIFLSPKEKFVWMTNSPIDKTLKGKRTQIQGFDNRKGYMFCHAISNQYTMNEGCIEPGSDNYERRDRTCNMFKGDATLVDLANARAFNYNAIPHQMIFSYTADEHPGGGSDAGMNSDRVLQLDGREYTTAPSQIMFEGLAEVEGAIYGTLAVASPGVDLVASEQPEFDINVYCWNEVETKFSRHLEFKDFEQYDLTDDLQLDIASIFTLGFHCATTSTNPLWAVFHQNLGRVFAWGGNVFQHPDSGVAADIILSPVPVQ